MSWRGVRQTVLGQLTAWLHWSDDLIGQAVRQELPAPYARALRLLLWTLCLGGLCLAAQAPTSAAAALLFPLLVTSFFQGMRAGLAFLPVALAVFWYGPVGGLDLGLMGILGAFCVLISGVTSQKYREIFAHRQGLLQRLQIAREVQRGLEPPATQAIGSLTVLTRMEVCNELGGDFVGLSSLEDGGALLVMGDVQGKGPQSALTAAYLQGAFHDCRQSGLTRPVDILERLHTLLAGKDEERFVTAICLRSNARGDRFEIANAGHPRPVLFGNGRPRMVGESGVVLGLQGVFELGCHQLTLQDGQRLLLMSDGCYEDEEVSPSLTALLSQPAIGLVQVIAWVKETGGELSDDRTVVLLAPAKVSKVTEPVGI